VSRVLEAFSLNATLIFTFTISNNNNNNNKTANLHTQPLSDARCL